MRIPAAAITLLLIASTGLGMTRASASTVPAPTAIAGPSPDPVAAQLQAAAAEKASLDAVKASLAGSVLAAKAQQSNLADLVAANHGAIVDTIARLADTQKQLAGATARAATEHANASAARLKATQDRRLLAQYARMRYVQQQGLVPYLFSSKSLPDLMGRSASLEHLSTRDQQMLTAVRRDGAEAEAAERAAGQDATAAAAAAHQLDGQRHQLQIQTDNANDLMTHLSVAERAATTEIARADAQTAALAQKVAELQIEQLDAAIAAGQEASWKAANYYVANHLGILPAAIASATGPTGGLLWAAPGATMSQPFGPSPYPFEPTFGVFPHFHTGIDMAAPMDTPILAAADGVVVSASESSTGYGYHLIIGHSTAMLSLYGHLATMLVHTGDTVHKGQLIGLMGSTGNSTGPHCHFEVRLHNVPTDPAPLLALPVPAP